MAIVTLTSDFGLEDYYVGAVKGTLLRLTAELVPPPALVDLTHSLPPGDVEAAGHLLAAAAPAFPPLTVHLAVVDPGVGSERRILALAAAGQLFVAPDNGLLTPFLEDGVAYAVEREDLFLAAPGATFHGRDRFAPVAAALLCGERIDELGPRLEKPVRLPIPAPRREDGLLVGRVAHVDRFGNLITDLPAEWLPDDPVAVRLGTHRVLRRVRFYDELPPGEPGFLVGSRGTLEISVAGQSLARRWRIDRGERVEVAPATDESGGAGTVSANDRS